jgi:hypothetical protein
MSDELEILRAWAPPDEAARDDAAVLRRARARLHVHLDRPPRSPWRRRLLVTVPATMATAALVVVLVVALGTSSHRTPPQRHPYATAPTTAAAALEQAARAADAQQDVVLPRPSQFFYTKSRETYLSCAIGGRRSFCALATKTRESWSSLLRDGRFRTHVISRSFPSEAERRKWIAAGRPPIAGTRDETMALHRNGHYFVGNDRLGYSELRDFGLSGAALYRRLRDGWVKGQGGTFAAELLTWVGDALRGQPAPPRLRAALYRALERLPDLTYAPAAKDALGRRAVAVGRVDRARGVRSELLIDPRTSELLGEREVVVAHVPHQGFIAPLGTVIGEAAYERRAVVDAAGQVP